MAMKTEVFKGWEQITPGTMTPLQYDQAVGDLVNYLQWMGEPAQNTRMRHRRLGPAVPRHALVVRMALERGVLERRQVSLSTRSGCRRAPRVPQSGLRNAPHSF